MLKIGTLALFSTSRLGVSMLAMMSLKDGVFCIGLYRGECLGALSIIHFFLVEGASCTKVLNKPNKIFCMDIYTSYTASVIHKMARLRGWKHCTTTALYNM